MKLPQPNQQPKTTQNNFCWSGIIIGKKTTTPPPHHLHTPTTPGPTQATEILTKKLSDILDTMAPVRTIQRRSKNAAWLSDQTKAMLKLIDAAQATAARTKNQDDWREYKNLRNSATARMRAENKYWEKQKLDRAQNSSSTLWQNVKSWLNWGNSGPPS